MSTVATTDRISHLRDLLGPAVLLPWPLRCKGDSRRWTHLQLADMGAVSHLTKLRRAGNIGVALGQVSNGLITIDFDQDSYVDTFLASNPLLADTLRTRGRRGCNIWIRCSSGYPPSKKLKDSSGFEIGEWRADGNQTIVSGTHPEGMPYQFVVERPVITISYDAIIWPTLIVAPRATESNRVRRVRENKVVGVDSDNAGSSSIEIFTRDLISQLAPTDFHQNNASLFDLGRLVRSYESAVGQLATKAELQFVFDRWCLVARRFWRHTRDDYWTEFLEAYHYARIGLNQDPLKLAFDRAKATALPDVTGFSDEHVKILAAICREMHQIMGDNPFFLPTRKLGELVGAHWGTVARWLIAIDTLGMIHLAPGEKRKRGGYQCPRYLYGPRLDVGERIVASEPSFSKPRGITRQLALPARA